MGVSGVPEPLDGTGSPVGLRGANRANHGTLDSLMSGFYLVGSLRFARRVCLAVGYVHIAMGVGAFTAWSRGKPYFSCSVLKRAHAAAKDVFMQMNCTRRNWMGPISGSLAHGCAHPTDS